MVPVHSAFFGISEADVARFDAHLREPIEALFEKFQGHFRDCSPVRNFRFDAIFHTFFGRLWVADLSDLEVSVLTIFSADFGCFERYADCVDQASIWPKWC
ncbi:hypothetical protein L596_022736 [Steinernema carpocapsae]|uniref:Uncharacterized protein n=1 Tax=Steinernema carpocapsae TaxID=34508 RepID=A0A4U5MN02_STECR|nr:hypothetical protein L596_022736 [Steinernema carpocapsae]